MHLDKTLRVFSKHIINLINELLLYLFINMLPPQAMGFNEGRSVAFLLVLSLFSLSLPPSSEPEML